jgi:hypothetical protein
MASSHVTIRHYCQGIGDCHLLKFTKGDDKPFWMLIDCGVHTSVTGGSKTIDRIVDDIASVTNRLDVIVATHEHADHLSGFSSAAAKFAGFEVGEIWMGWTENPSDPQATALDKYKDQALSALEMAKQVLDEPQRLSPSLSSVRDGLAPLLQFQFGAKGDRVRAMRDHLVELAPDNVRYFEPKNSPIAIPALPNLRIYVLGPPRDPALIKIVERASEMYRIGGAGSAVGQAMLNGFAIGEGSLAVGDDYAAPFDGNVGASLSALSGPDAAAEIEALGKDYVPLVALVGDHYLGPAKVSGDREVDQSWRRIDLDWLGMSAGLGMQLDAKTNNTSLVLAFELVDSGRVLLFTGDAQVGNWLGWEKLEWQVGDRKVTGPDLLARTIYYKVGHHGSENATLKQKGLELMTQPDFAAFIPTNKSDAAKVKWHEMPFGPILDDLTKRASGRVIRADDEWIAGAAVDPRFRSPSGAIKGVRHKPGLWVELDIA